MNWYFHALRKYAVFSGRARRREYWIFELWNTAILFVFFVLDIVATSKLGQPAVLAFLPSVYLLAMVVPSISSLVRRLHDTNHSGRWIFISLVPLVGGLILLAFTIKDSDPGDNRYGPNPKLPKVHPGAATPLATPEMGYLAPPLNPDQR